MAAALCYGVRGGGAQLSGHQDGGGSTATELVSLATDRYEMAMSATGEPFAVARAGHGPYLARMLRGGQASLRAELAAAYARKTGRVPASGALADALNVLEGIAMDRPPIPLELRVARHEDGLVLDLGDPSGRAVVITPAGWALTERLLSRLIDPSPAELRSSPKDLSIISEGLKQLGVSPRIARLAVSSVGWYSRELLPDRRLG
jgi:hypothetical protein